MKTLHIINQSPFAHRSAEECLTFCQPGDAVLFIEEGVYGVTAGSPLSAQLAVARQLQLYALQHDLESRGLTHYLPPNITAVDDAQFVALSVEHARILNWF